MIYAIGSLDTDTAVTFISPGGNGENALLSRSDADDGLREAKSGDVLVVRLGSALDTANYALSIGKRKGMITVLSVVQETSISSEIYRNSEIIVLGETQTEMLTGIKPDCEVNIALAVRKLREFGASVVVIALGDLGSAVVFGQEITLIPADEAKAVDTTSDKFLGALALGLSQKDDIVTAAQFATCASAV